MQALKIILKMTNVCAECIPLAVARSIVSIAAHREDSFHLVCMEALRNLSVSNAPLVAESDGFRVLLEAVLDPSFKDLSESILMSFLFLLNDNKGR